MCIIFVYSSKYVCTTLTKVLNNGGLSYLQTGPNLDLLRLWQSNAVPFCENHPNLYYDAKEVNKRW